MEVHWVARVSMTFWLVKYVTKINSEAATESLSIHSILFLNSQLESVVELVPEVAVAVFSDDLNLAEDVEDKMVVENLPHAA